MRPETPPKTRQMRLETRLELLQMQPETLPELMQMQLETSPKVLQMLPENQGTTPLTPPMHRISTWLRCNTRPASSEMNT